MESTAKVDVEEGRSLPPDSPLDSAADLSVRLIKPLLLEFQTQFGRERLEELLAGQRLSLSLSYLESPENFVSWHFAERLQNILISESGDPSFIQKAMSQSMTPDAIGFSYYLLRTFSDPQQLYRKVVELGPTFNRVGLMKVEDSSRNRVVISHRNKLQQRDRNFCKGRMAQFAAISTIWGVRPARVQELRCQVMGADACIYDIRWDPFVRSWRRYVGLALGVVAGLFVQQLGLSSVGLAATVVLGLMSGTWRDAIARLAAQDKVLLAQSDAMSTSMADLQRRHEELNKINQELENRVTQRTHDLTDANAKLESALQLQQDLDRQKTEFFDNVSHELRTPLTIILLSLESLLMRDSAQVPAPIREHLQAMDRSATRLIRLINNLLDLAKMEAGKKRLAYQPVEMHSFLKSLTSPFSIVAREKKIALEVIGQPVTSVMVDPEMMDVVFQNLVSNALKFTTSGSVSIHVTEDENLCIIAVKDTGPGMSPQDLAVIFDRFAQADSSGLRRFGGTGIGLALVKETVQLHGGTIVVTSELGQGATFQVSLPKGEQHIRQDLRERRNVELPVRRDRRGASDVLSSLRPQLATAAAGEVDSNAQSETTRGETTKSFLKTLLVVEDDQEIRRHVVAMFAEGYNVVEARDGVEGLQQAQTHKPDLIISDVMMPLMSGFQFVEKLRSDQETTDIPIILLTARHEVDSRISGLGLGANDYVAKPFSPKELVARVESQIRIRESSLRAVQSERLATMGFLSTGFAHEVRNPLNGLLNALRPLRDVLQDQPNGEAAETFVRIVEECGERVKSLAESLLSFAQPASDNIVDLVSSLEATLRLLSWKIPTGVKIERHFNYVDMIRGDQSGLNMLWLNLIDNALEAIGETGTLVLSTSLMSNEVVVAVKDTGHGIPKDIQEKIFEPFFSTRPPGKGTGLGLALCRRIVLQHRGEIRVESAPSMGTTFEVRLPTLGKALA